MSKYVRAPLCDFKLTVHPVVLNIEDDRLGVGDYRVFRLDILVDGKSLIGDDDQETAIDGKELWLSQRFNRKAWPLTCKCGHPQCAGFDEPVTTVRGRRVLTWTFPAHYFPYLKARGLVTGHERCVSLRFDARKFYLEFDLALAAIVQYEQESGKCSGFLAGSYAPPSVPMNLQLTRELAWYLKGAKNQRFARYAGGGLGQAAGKPN